MRISNLYGTVASTSNNAINLLYLAMNYESFKESDYIIFQDGQYSYYIVWGDLVEESGNVTAGDIEFIHYYRSDYGSYNYTYLYDYGTDSSFNLSLSSEYQTTSSIPGVGFVSLAAEQYSYYSYSVKNFSTMLDFYILSLALLIVIMFCALRGSNK